MRHVNAALVRHGHARQLAAVDATERIGDAADRAVRSAWRQLLGILRDARHVWTARQDSLRVLHGVLPAVTDAMHVGMVRLVTSSHRDAARNLVRNIPSPQLARLIAARSILREDEFVGLDEPGLLAIHATGDELRTVDRLAGLRDNETVSDDAEGLLRRLLFKPPAEADINAFVRRLVIGGETWEHRLAKAAPPWSLVRLADVIAAGYSQGKSQREIAADLLPVVDGVRSSARRLARTYGMAIAHETQMTTARQLGEMVTGYQVHATLDQWTRPAHRYRDGFRYYRRPAYGQRGMDECPHPPMEANGTPAWNCRCYLTPIIAGMPAELLAA